MTYRPCEGARGRPVPPADLPGERRWRPPAEVEVDVRLPPDALPPGTGLEPRLGTATIDAEGGVRWSAGETAPGGDACR